jgi:hypothetical protein
MREEGSEPLNSFILPGVRAGAVRLRPGAGHGRGRAACLAALATECAGPATITKPVAAASITHERRRAVLKSAWVTGTAIHVAGVRAETLRLTPTAGHGRGRGACLAALGTECAWPATITKPVAAASITHERRRAVLKPAWVAGAPVHVTGVRAEAVRLTPTAGHGRGRGACITALGTECAGPAGIAKPVAAASVTHERRRAVLKPAWVAGAPVHVTGVTAEAVRLTPTAGHGRGRGACIAALGTECAGPAGITKPVATASITHERGRAAWGTRAVLKPAWVAGTPVRVTGVRAGAVRLRPGAGHGRGRGACIAALGTECAWPAGIARPVAAASNTHERSRAILFVSGPHLRAAAVGSEAGRCCDRGPVAVRTRRRAAAVGSEAGRGAVLLGKVLAPAVHHALTDLLQAGFSWVSLRSALLSVNGGSAEQEANSRAQRPGPCWFHCGQCY